MQQIVDFALSDLIMVITPIVFGKLTLGKNLRKDKSKLVVAFLMSCILYGLSYLYLDGEIKTLCVFILHIFMFYYVFNVKFLKSCIVSFIYCSIVMICDFILLFTYLFIFNISKELCHDAMVGSLLSNIFVCFYAILITILFKNKIIKVFKTDYIDGSFIILIILGYALFIFSFFAFILNYMNDYNYVLSLIIIFVLLIIVFSLVKYRIQIYDKIKEYNILLNFMKNYEIELEEKRIKGHEVKNQISTINSMLKDKANKYKLEKYVKDLAGDYADLDNVNFSDLQYLPSNGIKGFICSKISFAASKEIDVEVIIEKDIETSILTDLNNKDFKYLCIILGVLLDNAIEASLDSINKKMGIEIYLIDKNVLIVITNSYDNKKIDKSNIFKSYKGVDRGNGLKLVKRIINQSNRFKLLTEVNLNNFVQKLTIKKY